MYLNYLRTENFRNLKNQVVELSKGLNLLVGPNAQGKTNFLEAIYILSTGKSFRYARDEDYISFYASFPKTAIIEGNYTDDNGLIGQLKLVISVTERGKEKKAFFQGKKLDALQDLQGKLLIVEFLPSDVYLASDEPSERRKFLDNLISVLKGEYREWLREYQSVVREKNKLLEMLSEGEGDPLLLQTYNSKIAQLGSLIIYERLKILSLLKRYVKVILSRYSFKENVELTYSWSLSVEPGDLSPKEIRELLKRELERSIDKERRIGYSLIGPHRDSLEFKVNGLKIKYVLSQSQSNILSLALKFSKAAIFKRFFNKNPIMILDEPFAYIDEKNATITLSLLSRLDQVILASNRWESYFKDWVSKRFNVRAGSITPA